mmetsp:Transcript_2686/g.4038  ORF Transcript_2686/g.4038 Transcript_2686/m.4038 type:complete len:455 (+) Transcript_2686:56-1420(+)
MSKITPEARHILDKVLLDPHNMATPKELEQQCLAALQALKRADYDQNNIITLNEIGKLCEILGLPIQDKDDKLYELDKDQSGQLENMEFLEWWLRRLSTQPGNDKQQEVMAKNTFEIFDRNRSGAISADEFADLVESLGVQFTEKECQQAIVELDKDGSGEIECNEFVQWWVNRTQSVRQGGGLIAYKLKRLANKAAQMFHTDIHTAAWKGDRNLVAMFLDSESRLLNSPDTSEYGNGWTPLHYACYRGHKGIVEELLNRNVNVNRANDDGFSPLFYAAQQEHVDICALLLQAGADPTIVGSDPCFPAVHPMCPVDHLVDNEELKSVFLKHEKCRIPGRIENLSGASLSADGQLYFEVSDLAEVSMLPIKTWRLSSYIDGNFCSSDDVSSFTQENRANAVTKVSCRPNREFLKKLAIAASDRHQITVDVIVVNAIGAGEVSESVELDMSAIFSD